MLDSFEVAQYKTRYGELWPVLEALTKEIKSLRVLVSGRVAVADLKLGTSTAASIHLDGLSKTDAKQWLKANRI